MIPFFKDDTLTLYQGDTLGLLQHLPESTFDGVLTDPPYSSGGIGIGARQVDPSKKYQSSGTCKAYPPMLGDCKDQRSWAYWCTLWLAQCWRVAKEGAPLLVFTDWRQLPSLTDAVQAAGWRWLGIVPWNKRSARPQIGKFRQQCEYVIFACKGAFKPLSRSCLPGLYDYTVISQNKVHLTSKPVALLCDLMAVMEPGGLILDPFIGGGSTAAAAHKTGRRCVGMELSPEYARIAAGYRALS